MRLLRPYHIFSTSSTYTSQISATLANRSSFHADQPDHLPQVPGPVLDQAASGSVAVSATFQGLCLTRRFWHRWTWSGSRCRHAALSQCPPSQPAVTSLPWTQSLPSLCQSCRPDGRDIRCFVVFCCFLSCRFLRSFKWSAGDFYWITVAFCRSLGRHL